MLLADFLMACSHSTRLRVFNGNDYFDIENYLQMTAFANFLHGCECNWEVKEWNVQNITFTEWGKDGDRIETTERVLFIYVK